MTSLVDAERRIVDLFCEIDRSQPPGRVRFALCGRVLELLAVVVGFVLASAFVLFVVFVLFFLVTLVILARVCPVQHNLLVAAVGAVVAVEIVKPAIDPIQQGLVRLHEPAAVGCVAYGCA